MVVQPAVFIVDDDSGVRDFIRVLLEFAGFGNVRAYESSRRFLDEGAFRDGDCSVTRTMRIGRSVTHVARVA